MTLDNNHTQETPFVNILGERVALGPLRRDLPYQRWLNAFETTRTVGKSHPMTQEQAEAWYDRYSTLEQDAWFVIYERSAWLPIGLTGLLNIGFEHRRAEFGIIIGESGQRGKGYGTETARLILDYAFTARGLHSVMLWVHEYNLAGKRAYEKAGFRVSGRRRECSYLGGKMWDHIMMDCLATEFISPVLKNVFTPDQPGKDRCD
jgi:RimJ/RimL family protein N-acetyltransferase